MGLEEITAPEIAEELPSPERRRLRVPRTGPVLVALILVSLGFGGGVLEARHKGVTATSAAGSSNVGAAARTATAGGTAAGGAASGVTVGTVKLVDGDAIYLTTGDGSVVKVTTSKATQLQVSKTGSSSDLKTGASVVVQGTADATGNVAATSISQSSGSSAALAPQSRSTAGAGAPPSG